MTSKARQLADLGGDTANLEDISSAYSSGALSNRNKIINGAMTIDQRNAGAAISSPADQYTLDRWYSRQDGAGVASIQQSTTAPAGFSSSLLATVTTADASLASTDRYWLAQYIEGFNFSDTAFGTASAKAITISFWVRSNLTGTFSGSIVNSALNRSYPFTYSISSADTWEQKSVTIAGDTTGTWVGGTNGIGLRVYFSLGSGSTYSGTAGAWAGARYEAATGGANVMATLSNTFYLTGVQLEAGDTATPFEHRSCGAELALCQRYFQSSFATGTAPATGLLICMYVTGTAYSTNNGTGLGTRFPVDMRSTPTIAYYPASPASGSVGTVSVFSGGWANRPATPHDSVSPTMQAFDINANGAFTVGPFMCQYNYTVNAEL